MEQLYHETNRIIQETHQCFQELNNPKVDSIFVENTISTKIATVNANCDRLDVLVFKVPVSQRSNAKMRVDQLKYDIRHLQSALQNWQQKKQKRETEIQDREQLLNRRFTSNADTTIDLDYSLQQHNSMNNAHRGIDEMLMTGQNVLGSLHSQRDTLKGAHKRILDIGNTLGLSNHTMKLIERRIHEDKYVLLGGMAVTTVIIVGIIYYFVL
ncbi:probable Golgi SNAP receptor complex member 2 [Bradysia coprophila]|uniref:probable Golgi SNAP receptor complex member 2 n=1 Tax=Bradysia coprophila TaxID=38358 RepID=UPI00187DA8F5|nr:probable Golgi SNAP receptor complex member 2 [Bradysia coprophila]